MLDSRVYDIELDEGDEAAYTANTIAECIYSQVDTEGKAFLILDDIQDHRKGPDAITKDRVTAKSNHTTKGWDLQCATCDGTTEWFPLQYLKESLLNMLSSARTLMNLSSNGGCITRLGSATTSSLRLMLASRRSSQVWHRSAGHRKASAGD